MTMTTATLEVRHDGIRANGMVQLGKVACSVDAVLEAAMQDDAELASDYRKVLTDIAPQLHARIKEMWDGSRENCVSWLSVTLVDAATGDALTTPRQFSRTYRGARLCPAQPHYAEARAEVERRLGAIGLGAAK